MHKYIYMVRVKLKYETYISFLRFYFLDNNNFKLYEKSS